MSCQTLVTTPITRFGAKLPQPARGQGLVIPNLPAWVPMGKVALVSVLALLATGCSGLVLKNCLEQTINKKEMLKPNVPFRIQRVDKVNGCWIMFEAVTVALEVIGKRATRVG